jgi:hypothetical protein
MVRACTSIDVSSCCPCDVGVVNSQPSRRPANLHQKIVQLVLYSALPRISVFPIVSSVSPSPNNSRTLRELGDSSTCESDIELPHKVPSNWRAPIGVFRWSDEVHMFFGARVGLGE